jgi:hypothetical protein
MRYALTIPGTPPSFNVYDHWKPYKQRDEKRRWQADVIALCNEKGNRAPRGLEKATLRAVIYFAVVRGRDGDNYSMPLWKWSLDALRLAGVLIDDTADRVTALPPVLQVGQSEQTFVTLSWEG